MLRNELQSLGLAGTIKDDAQTIQKFSIDASLFEIKPEIVIEPKNVEDIKKIVVFAGIQKKIEPNISITPRSAGTDMSGGPLNSSIILDFTKSFNHIREIKNTADGAGYAITEPGVFYRDFEVETLKQGLLLPPYPASRELCTVGGMAANNSAGEKTLTYGKVEDYVQELRIIFADGKEYTVKPLTRPELDAKIDQHDFEGTIYKNVYDLIEENYELLKKAKPKVSKNSAGYYLWNVWNADKTIFDLTKVLVGSQGTLGIITEIKYRLVRVPTKSKMLIIFMKDLKPLADLVNAVLAFKPETFESYDDKTLQLAMRFFPEMIKVMKPDNMFKLALQFMPEAWMVMTGGMPKLILMAEFTGTDQAEVDARAKQASDAIKKFGLKTRIVDHAEAQKYWTIRRESFNLLRKHVQGKRTAPFIDDVVVRPEFLPEFLPQLNAILAKYDLIYTIAGHVGDGNFHIIPLMDFSDPRSHKIIPELSERVYELVVQYHGSITAEHNDGLVRTPYLPLMYGKDVYALFEELKTIFDSQNILNPGKKVGASLEYSLAHIVNT